MRVRLTFRPRRTSGCCLLASTRCSPSGCRCSAVCCGRWCSQSGDGGTGTRDQRRNRFRHPTAPLHDKHARWNIHAGHSFARHVFCRRVHGITSETALGASREHVSRTESRWWNGRRRSAVWGSRGLKVRSVVFAFCSPAVLPCFRGSEVVHGDGH